MDSDLPEFNKNDPSVYDFFKRALDSYRDTEVSENDIHKFHNYSDILHKKLDENKFSYRNEEIMQLVAEANELYDDVFGNDAYCLVHGDMHRYNIMKSGELITAIDPIGYIAPIELDIARFIGTELTDTNEDVQIKKSELIEYFAPLSSKKRIESLLFVDMVFRLHNSIFENDTFELTDKWLSILK